MKLYPNKIRKPRRKRPRKPRKNIRNILNLIKGLTDVAKPTEIKKFDYFIYKDEIHISVAFEREKEAPSNITRINNVSLEIMIDGEFVQVARYDNHEGKAFHKHVTVDGKDYEMAVDVAGSPADWLNFALKDFKDNFQKYMDEYGFDKTEVDEV